MKSFNRTLIIAFIAMVYLTASVSAGEHTSVYYNQPGKDYWNIDQYIWIEQKAPLTFFANQFVLSDNTNNKNIIVGYLGLQTTTTGDKALFSIWNANDAKGQDCKQFEEDGYGYQCFIPFKIEKYTYYKLRVWILGSDSKGQWWGAWIINGTKENFVGMIRVPKEYTRAVESVSWTEYYGYYSTCRDIPKSLISWYPPSFNNNQLGSTYKQYGYDSCTNFEINPNYYGYIRLGKGG